MSKKEREDFTRLSGKEYSPLTIRKYTAFKGLPLFVALITDNDLSDLDSNVVDFIKQFTSEVESFNLQTFRNFAGYLTEYLMKKYDKAEGIAVILFPDKACISSLWGDFMNHTMCREELYFLVNTMTNV